MRHKFKLPRHADTADNYVIVEPLPAEDEEANTGDAICVIEGDL